MGLKIRDVIQEESLEAYNEFMSNVADTSFLSLDFADDRITVTEHHGADETIIRSDSFAANDLAQDYFDQENDAVRLLNSLGLTDMTRRSMLWAIAYTSCLQHDS